MRWYCLLLLAAFAPQAAAQALIRCETGTGASPTVLDESTCYDFTGSTDSPLFRIAAPSATVCLDPDTAGTGGAATAYLVRCQGATATGNSCVRVLTDQDGLPGKDDLPLNGDETAARRCIYGVPTGWYYIDVQTSAGGVTARAEITGQP